MPGAAAVAQASAPAERVEQRGFALPTDASRSSSEADRQVGVDVGKRVGAAGRQAALQPQRFDLRSASA